MKKTLLFKTTQGDMLYEMQDEKTLNIELVSNNPKAVKNALKQDAVSNNPVDRARAEQLLWGIYLFGLNNLAVI